MSIHRRIIKAIEQWHPIDDALKWSDKRFERLAAAVFAHQYTHNSSYRTFCHRRDITPDDDPPSRLMPAVPTDAFKYVRLFCDDVTPRHTFRTSGTSKDARGEHHFQTLDVYRSSLHPTFARFCHPNPTELRMLVLAPSPDDLPDSSLSFMLGELVDRHGDSKSEFFVTLGDHDRWKIRSERFGRAVASACNDGVSTLVFGTAFAFAEVFDQLTESWRLPDGSVVVETGGFKGRSTTVSRSELYGAFTHRLGVPPRRCMSEYSMTELSSQTYTDHLASRRSDDHEPTGLFYAPPWLHIAVVDPIDLTVIDTPNTPGLIRFFDLANIDSVSAIQTSDRGILHSDGGLELLGRAAGAELRGCSLTIEEIISNP